MSWLVACVMFVAAPVCRSKQPASVFIAFGDWGRDSNELNDVVSSLKKESPEFVVLLGDNFYPKGVKSVSDSQFKLFNKFSGVASKFYAILGNHDYGYSESRDAQIAYSKVDSKWHMPHNYHSKAVYRLGDSVYTLCMVFLDTHVFEPDQANWLTSVLGSPECQSSTAYRLVFGHYPVFTAGIYAQSREVKKARDKLVPVFEEHNVHAYISGHEHQFQALEKNGIQYFISGAVAEMNRKKGMHEGHLANKVAFFEDNKPGYLRVRFEEPRLVCEFVAGGKVLYTQTIKGLNPVTTTTTALPVTTTILAPTEPEEATEEATGETTKQPIQEKVTTKIVTTQVPTTRKSITTVTWKNLDDDSFIEPEPVEASDSLTSKHASLYFNVDTLACLTTLLLCGCL